MNEIARHVGPGRQDYIGPTSAQNPDASPRRFAHFCWPHECLRAYTKSARKSAMPPLVMITASHTHFCSAHPAASLTEPKLHLASYGCNVGPYVGPGEKPSVRAEPVASWRTAHLVLPASVQRTTLEYIILHTVPHHGCGCLWTSEWSNRAGRTVA